MKNCQPFTRALGGPMHLFAHNGDLAPKSLRLNCRLVHCRPSGDTDSEFAFCLLLERLRRLWHGDAVPPLDERMAVVTKFAAAVRLPGAGSRQRRPVCWGGDYNRSRRHDTLGHAGAGEYA